MGVVISTGATSSISAAASANAARSIKKRQCKVTMKDFTDKESTIEQKQQYAECVQLIHPASIDITMFSVFIVIIVACFIASCKFILD